MQVRRCAVWFLESREKAGFDLGSLLNGRAGLGRSLHSLLEACCGPGRRLIYCQTQFRATCLADIPAVSAYVTCELTGLLLCLFFSVTGEIGCRFAVVQCCSSSAAKN